MELTKQKSNRFYQNNRNRRIDDGYFHLSNPTDGPVNIESEETIHSIGIRHKRANHSEYEQFEYK